jgi:thymidine kinase
MVVENVGGLDKYEARCRLHFEGARYGEEQERGAAS